MKKNGSTPIDISPEEFREAGHLLIDRIADYLGTVDRYKVTSGAAPKEIQRILGDASLPEKGVSAPAILSRATELLFNHSLLNGHPKFLGYITSSPAPIGALSDLLTATINANVGANILSPMATAIEKQTIKWLAEFINVSPDYGGILVSGGNMANFTAFLAARTAKASKELKEEGLKGLQEELVFYCSKTTHTWIEKAAALFGHGLKSIRWIGIKADRKMDNKMLRETIENDLKNGKKPFMVVGTAGDVSTGMVDELSEIAAICETYNLWFHVDGAYGAPAAALPNLRELFAGMERADSIALDPHKWLYSPLEAGCTLVKNPKHLTDTFSSHPTYYNFGDSDSDLLLNFYEYGLQNSRGFRALKVWTSLQQAGKSGYVKMIDENIKLAELLYELADNHPELEAVSQHLSITNLRYVPEDIVKTGSASEGYLNSLNEKLLNVLQSEGKAFLSNALVSEKYCLRGCIVNFRTSKKDIEEIIDIIVDTGSRVHAELR
jgi:aromatic-L-amino-acid decarboxylase